MIHELTVSNYFSIYEETVLDLRIPGTAPQLGRFRKSPARPTVRLPSVVVVMGPNGSGKTTLLRALVEVVHVATNYPGTPGQNLISILPFSSSKAQNEPTKFRVDFDADWLAPGEAWQLFRYEVLVGRRVGERFPFILHEALLHFPKGRKRRLFERGAPGEAIYVSHEFGLRSNDERLKAVKDDSSVISTLAVLNVPLAILITASLQLFVTNMFYHGKWEPRTDTAVGLYENNDKMRGWMKRQMQRSDLAIQDVSFDTNPFSTEKQVNFDHRGLNGKIPLVFESSGTQRLFHLIPQLYIALDSGSPVVLDEIDGDLHVAIVNEIIHWFHTHETNPHNAQLFVTAHNVGVLDDLEKEELFIVEKGQDGATRIHSAQDVSGLRRDTRLYPKYRAGVLGGIPKIG